MGLSGVGLSTPNVLIPFSTIQSDAAAPRPGKSCQVARGALVAVERGCVEEADVAAAKLLARLRQCRVEMVGRDVRLWRHG